MRGAAAFVDSGRRTTHKCYNVYSDDDTRRSSSDQRLSQILVENRDFGLSQGNARRNIAITFGTEN